MDEAKLVELDQDIADAYERLAEVADDAVLAHVVKREIEVNAESGTPVARRGFLSYLRWACAHPEAVLASNERPGCPCAGTGWREVGDGVVPCPEHQPPPPNTSRVRDARALAAAARGREADERRYG